MVVVVVLRAAALAVPAVGAPFHRIYKGGGRRFSIEIERERDRETERKKTKKESDRAIYNVI